MELMMTKVRTRHGHWGTPIAMSLSQLADVMRSDRRSEEVNRLAGRAEDARRHDDPSMPRELKGRDRLPYLIFSSLFSRRGLHDFSLPTGLVLLSIDLGADSMAASLLRRQAEQLPQTVMAFTGASRRTLKIVARCTPADGILPADSFAYLSFLKQAQQQAVRYFEARLGCHIPIVEESLTRGCRMSQDSNLYYNAEAKPIDVITGMDELRRQYPLARTDRRGNFESEPSAADIERQRTDYYTCVERAWEETDATDDDPVSQERFMVRLAELCRKSALPEEACVRRTGNYSRWQMDTDTVRKIFHTVYAKKPEGRPWSQMSPKERIARKVKDFFDRRYELRYNVMKQTEEFRPKGVDYHPWQPLSERDIRRLGQEEMMDCGAAWPIDIEQYARSSLSRDYNPVHEFLAGCGTWDGRRDYIGQLARRVPCSHPAWERLFHRWFLGMVAGWLGRSRDYGNAVVPLLVGRQGCRKSTFCKLLLPHSLREYYIDDLKLDSAEQAERVLSRMALVNIDEYNAKTDREQAKIKRLLTERDVQVRRMRSDQYLMLQRMASFIATTNERQPLTDRTGSRRYLCVEVTGTIDTVSPLNYQQLYAQALYELDHGEAYYMSPEEERMMEEYNVQFQNCSTAEILLASYYRPAPRKKAYFMRAVDILTDLQQRIRGADRPNMQRLVTALKAQHFEYGAMDGQRGWYVTRVMHNA